MMSQIKRALVLLLVIVIAAVPMTASALPETSEKAADPGVVSAFPQPESADKSMETALIAVKSLVKIDDEVYTDFSYYTSYSNYETMEGLLWTFYWSGDNYSSIQATATAEGVLLNYRKYAWKDNETGFAKIAKNKAIDIADEFIKKANPETFSYYKAPTDVYTSIGASDYNIVYTAEINGYPFDFSQIDVSINKFTGEITGYGRNRIDPRRYKFEKPDDLITRDTAIAAYAEKIGFSLEYRSSYNYEDGSYKIFPVYLLNSYRDLYIDAKTGDVVTLIYDTGFDDLDNPLAPSLKAMDASEAESMSGGGSRAVLTPGEIAAIEKVSTFITNEQALRKLLEIMELTDLDVSSFDEQYIRLNKDWYNDNRYIYSIFLYKYVGSGLAAGDDITSVFGIVDAVTGRVTSFDFDYYGILADGQKVMTDEQVDSAVTAFLKKNAPNELAKSKLDSLALPVAVPYSYYGDRYHYNYIRYENGAIFRDNGINVSYNPITKKVTNYSLTWFDDAKFPDISGVIAPQQALTVFVEQNGSNLKYITTGEGKATIVYDFVSKEYIDPFTGKALDYKGEPWADSVTVPDYGDVKGHWCESYVNKLLDNGVFLWGGKFEPEKIMTELEFLQYIMLAEYNDYVPRSEMVSYFAQRGVEVSADPDKLLTRQEAARIVAEFLGYGKLAEQQKWFVYPFSDKVADEYKGYITICYMLGIVSGDAGRFNATSNVTRAHGAVILCNLIENK